MAAMFRCFEGTKQCMGVAPPQWTPTSNARNQAMVKEVQRFATEVARLHKQMREMDATIQASMSVFKGMLMTPLPRVFDDQPTLGGVMPVDNTQRAVGTNVHTEGLTAACVDMHARLHNDVLLPIEHWLHDVKTTQTENSRLEQMRLDLDRVSRTTKKLSDKYRQKTAAQKPADNVLVKAQVKEDKTTRLYTQYAEKEVEVYNSLLKLTRESVLIRELTATGINIYQACLVNAHNSFDLATPVPTPLGSARIVLPEEPMGQYTLASSVPNSPGATLGSPGVYSKAISQRGFTTSPSKTYTSVQAAPQVEQEMPKAPTHLVQQQPQMMQQAPHHHHHHIAQQPPQMMQPQMAQ